MALTNYERQKRWRNKNRATYNLRRRNKRKNTGEKHDSLDERGGIPATDTIDRAQSQKLSHGESTPLTHPSTIDGLRQLMKQASAEPTSPVAKPLIYRNDYGQVISETQWNVLQKRKEEAIAGGYVIDEFSQ